MAIPLQSLPTVKHHLQFIYPTKVGAEVWDRRAQVGTFEFWTRMLLAAEALNLTFYYSEQGVGTLENYAKTYDKTPECFILLTLHLWCMRY